MRYTIRRIKEKSFFFLLSIILFFLLYPEQAETAPLADTIVHGIPVKIADSFKFTEGPAVDASGNVFFTDQPNNRILKYDLSGKVSVFLEPSGRSNGMYFDNDGNLISCADEKDELWSISPKKEVSVLVTNFKVARLNGPNDLWIAPNG